MSDLARPKALQTLIATMDAAGWQHAEGWGEDTGGDTFVTVEGVSPDRERKLRATWHTRRPGIHQPIGTTLRLFSAMLKRPYQGWTDATVKALTAAITAEEA